VGRMPPDGRKAGTQGFVGPLTPGNGLVRLGGKLKASALTETG
jgi:hypothetical protein